MRRLFFYELHKLAGVRYLWIMCALLLILNGVLVIRMTSDTAEASRESIDKAFSLYYSSTEEAEEKYSVLSGTPELYESGFTELFDRVAKIRAFPAKIQRAVNTAEKNLIEYSAMGIDSDSFPYKYQEKVAEIYSARGADTKIALEYTVGWEDFLTYDGVNIFIFIAVMSIAAVVFVGEKTSDALTIIRTARNGRSRTVVAKLSALTVVSVAAVLVFTGVTWLLFYFRVGFSSPANAIQAFDTFTYCPYNITVGEYFAHSVAVKLIVFTAFSALSAAVAVFVYNYATSYLICLGLFGVNFWLYTLKLADSPIKILNMMSVSTGHLLFGRYRALDLFGSVVGFASFAPVFYLLTAVFFWAVTAVKYTRGEVSVLQIPFLVRVTALVQKTVGRLKLKLYRKKRYSTSVFSTELYKTLIASRYILIVILILLIKICLVGNEPYFEGYGDKVYKEYMTVLEGEITEEKINYIDSERKMISDIISKEDEMAAAYEKGEITTEEYTDYRRDFSYAHGRDELLMEIEKHRDYILQLESEGREAWFVYDTGWRELFLSGFDITLYAVIVLAVFDSFASEYNGRVSSGSFSGILRTLKKGRERVFAAKFVSAVAVSTVFSVIWNGIDLITLMARYDMPCPDAPIYSVRVFFDFAVNMTFGQYVIVFYAIRILAAALLAVTAVAFSAIFKKTVFIIVMTLTVTVLPTLLWGVGLKVFDSFGYHSFMTATPLFTLGGVAVTYLVFILTVSVAAIIYSERKWCR
ncbi:MAG: hypothetical protein IJF13_05540 [Clostridia bacterium]|nr:hypothetical protein [Clostridia bacterium]